MRVSREREYSSNGFPACASSKISSNSPGPCTIYVSRARQPAGMFSIDSVGEYEPLRRRLRVFHVLRDEALDVKLAEDEALARAVVAEPTLVFVNLPLRILLRRIFIPIEPADEARVQRARVLATDGPAAGPPFGCAFPATDQERQAFERIGTAAARRLCPQRGRTPPPTGPPARPSPLSERLIMPPEFYSTRGRDRVLKMKPDAAVHVAAFERRPRIDGPPAVGGAQRAD